MAVQFHPLPREVFPEAARPYIERLNSELRELFALEGTIKNPIKIRRSDLSVARRSEVQVAVSRITPSIASVVSGVSTVVGTPALVLGTVNTAGTTTTAVSVNSAVALFDATVPEGISNTAATGTVAFAARRNHRHDHPVFSTGDLHTDLLPLSGVRDMTGELGSDVGTFRSDVASGGVGFRFNTSQSFAAGTVFRFSDNGSTMLEQTFEGHAAIIGSETAAGSADVLSVRRTITADNRNSFRGLNANIVVSGAIPAGSYLPTIIGTLCNVTFNPTSAPVLFGANIRGGDFAAQLTGSTKAVTTLRGGFFSIEFGAGYAGTCTDAFGGDFRVFGVLGGTATNVYGVRSQALTFGTNRWGFWGSNKVHCDASDFIAATNAKGLITKDAQSTPRFWRMYTEAVQGTTGGVTIAIDAAGALSATRVAGATGTINIQLVDVGVAAPAA